MTLPRRSAAVLLCLLVSLPAAALQLAQPGIYATIVEFGRYRLESLRERQYAADTTAGYSSIVDAALLERSSKVPVRLGEAFGYRFAISDVQRDAEWIPVEIRISHPPIADHRGRAREGFVMQSAAHRGPDGQYRNAAYYILSEPRELAAGRWEISVFYQGRQLLRQAFDLVAESAGPEQRGSDPLAGSAAAHQARRR